MREAGASRDECSRAKSCRNSAEVVPALAGLAFERPVLTRLLAFSAVALPKPRRAAKYAFTSTFLIRPIAAPIARLITWTVLVWSEAWKAGGEKKKL
jgi:hypothetical protein